MDTTKSHGFFLASFLVFMFLGDLTEACSSCPEISLRDACCRDDFVMRVQFMSVRRDPDFPIHLNIFRINPIEIFKGRDSIRKARVFYSPEEEDYCGYHHRGPLRRDDYLVSGLIDDMGLQIRKCHLAKPWNEVPMTEKVKLNSLDGEYVFHVIPSCYVQKEKNIYSKYH